MTVRIPRAVAERALRFVVTAASKDDVTPVLTGVRWKIDGGTLTLVATDRYRVCVATLTVPDGTPEMDVLMTREQAVWILKQKHMPLGAFEDQFIEVSASDRIPLPLITARVVAAPHEGAAEFSMVADGIAGNFPPVERLFVEPGKAERADVVGLSPLLLDFLKLMPAHRGEPIRMYAPEMGGKKAGPVQFESYDKSLRALLQPNLLVD